MTVWLAVAVFAPAYLFIATERIPRLAAALGGAGIVLAFGVVGADDISSHPKRSASTGTSCSCCSP